MYTEEHFQWDLDICRLDFMFVKPRDVPEMFSFNVQTGTIFFITTSHDTKRFTVPPGDRNCYNKSPVSVCTLKRKPEAHRVVSQT